MTEARHHRGEQPGDFVTFLTAGTPVEGEFHCAGCGYGVSVYRKLPRCPMCGGEDWEQSEAGQPRRARSILN